MLHTAIHERHRLLTLAVHLRLLAGDFGHEILAVGVIKIGLCSAFHHYLAQH